VTDRFPGKQEATINQKTIELWGGPHDGRKVRVEPTAEWVIFQGVYYEPVEEGDYSRNRFRYATPERDDDD
jgi:hypothetical protein